MKILHTSDWHIGHEFFGRKRYEEFELFFEWLYQQIVAQGVEAMLVSGDVFDTTNPSNRSQSIYYDFLCRLQGTTCRHVVVIGGNHDSPTLLDAPNQVLARLNVRVVGSARKNCHDEVILLTDEHKQPQLVVCAVPYLRDRDVRSSERGESQETKVSNLLQGIDYHYQQVIGYAQQLRQSLAKPVPLVAMGHLFAAGGKIEKDEQVRELYVGNIVRIGGKIFGPACDYVALGHLHSHQTVGGNSYIRYCGSPLCGGFCDAGLAKQVLVVDFPDSGEFVPTITPLEIPNFQNITTVSGSWPAVASQLRQLVDQNKSTWVRVLVENSEADTNLFDKVKELLIDTPVECLLCKRLRENGDSHVWEEEPAQTLSELDATDVFVKFLESRDISGELTDKLKLAYQSILADINENDEKAE